MQPTETEMRRIKMLSAEKEIRAILARDFSASRMNATKWREVIEAIGDLELRYRLQWVDVSDASVWMRLWLPFPNSTYFDSGDVGPFRTFTIEWLEIDPTEKVNKGMLLEPERISHAEEIARRLQEINVPYHWEGSSIRIIGHVRKQSKIETAAP